MPKSSARREATRIIIRLRITPIRLLSTFSRISATMGSKGTARNFTLCEALYLFHR